MRGAMSSNSAGHLHRPLAYVTDWKGSSACIEAVKEADRSIQSELGGRGGRCFACCCLPMLQVGKHPIKHGLAVLKQLCHGFEQGAAHNVEEANLQQCIHMMHKQRGMHQCHSEVDGTQDFPAQRRLGSDSSLRWHEVKAPGSSKTNFNTGNTMGIHGRSLAEAYRKGHMPGRRYDANM